VRMSSSSLSRLTYASLVLGFAGLFSPWAIVQVDFGPWFSVPLGWEPPSSAPITLWEGWILGGNDYASQLESRSSYASSAVEAPFRMGLAASRAILIGWPVVWTIMLVSGWRHLSRASRVRVLTLLGFLMLLGIVLLGMMGPELLRYAPAGRFTIEALHWQWSALGALLMSMVLGIGVSIIGIIRSTKKHQGSALSSLPVGRPRA